VEPFSLWELMRDDLLRVCPMCEAPVHVVIQPVGIGSMDPRLDPGPMYMSQLARKGLGRKDPDAWVSGPHSWRRRLDRAQREGAQINQNPDDMRSPREIKREERRAHGS
jgi:hypothetical protein